MSLDGFIAGPDNAMDWVMEYFTEDRFPEVMQATGAMLVGRGTHEVAKRMPPSEGTDYDGGPVFVLTHRPPAEPEHGVTFLSCDLAVYVLPVLLGDGVHFSTPGLGRIDLEPFSTTQSGPVTMLRFRVRT